VSDQIIPEFMLKTLKANGFQIGHDACLVYENGTGNMPKSVIGTIVYPPRSPDDNTVDALELDSVWIFPKSKADGTPAQNDLRASLLRINKRFVIETGVVFNAADYPEEDASEENE
jgi:hypothetical protein